MEEFFQSGMDSVIMSEPNTPYTSRTNPNSNRHSNLIDTPLNIAQNLHNLSIVTDDLNSPDLHDKRDTENNVNDKRATRYDYLDYGNYINKVLCTQLLTFSNPSNINGINSDGNGSVQINWNFDRTQDKVDVVNLILQLIEQRSMFQNLLSQSRDAMDQLKRQIHDSTMKIQNLQQSNKQLSNKQQMTQQR